MKYNKLLSKLGFTDLAFAILFPEVKALQLTIMELGTTRLAKKQMTKSASAALKQLPTINMAAVDKKFLQNKVISLLDPNGELERARKMFLENPAKLGEELGKLSKEEKEAFSEKFSEVTGIGEPDASPLSSSAVSRGIFTPTSATSGNLEMTFRNGGTYTYPGCPLSIWNSMKEASGTNGSGAYSVFYYGWWKNAGATEGMKVISQAFRLSGIGK